MTSLSLTQDQLN